MIKPTAQTEFHVLHPFLVKCKHVWYDTTVESQTPPIIKEKTRYYIQWKNIASAVKQKLTPKFHRAVVFAYAGIQGEPLWMKYYRFAIAFVGTAGRNPDWVSAGTAEEGAAHASVSGFTISQDATGADILVFRASLDVNSHTISTTYAGNSLTQVTSVTTNRAAYIQYIGSPTTGTNNLVATYSVNDNGFGLVTCYSGTAGTMSNGTTTTGNATTASLSVTTTSGDMAVDALTVGTAATSITIGAGQTQRGSNTTDTWFHNFRGSEETATGASVNMSWTWTTTSNFAYAAAKIDQAVTATSRPSFLINFV